MAAIEKVKVVVLGDSGKSHVIDIKTFHFTHTSMIKLIIHWFISTTNKFSNKVWSHDTSVSGMLANIQVKLQRENSSITWECGFSIFFRLINRLKKRGSVFDPYIQYVYPWTVIITRLVEPILMQFSGKYLFHSGESFFQQLNSTSKKQEVCDYF